ncbi:hypothetical protein BSL78_14117 [Apostichopus japonicus]|uniref:Uncharacterized protein n=1 Tax=Stichopus japonicus TaxID=307972 RepID=A0A2G8KLX3_STIJA|nr:hypothetical protein BSL78_14117 [Apostichopus japonicus]
MESTFETLKTLRRLSEKRVRYRHHLSNYRLYRKNKTVPKGLKIKVRAGLPLSDSDSFANWKGILKNASLELMAVQISICRKTIHELSQQIDSKTRKLQKELPKNEFERKLDSISKICLNLSHTLASRQCHKLKRDNVTKELSLLVKPNLKPQKEPGLADSVGKRYRPHATPPKVQLLPLIANSRQEKQTYSPKV